MALPFFKKSDEKMPSRPAAKPAKPAARAPEAPPKAAPPPEDDLGDLDFTGIEVVEEADPLAGAIEAAAIAFANDRNDETEATLRGAIGGGEATPEAERLWLMLFDFYLITGRRDAFAPLELEFAKLFEKQPPVWRELGYTKGAKPIPVGANAFKGALAGSNAEGMGQLEQWLATDAKPRLDLSKVTAVDVAGCSRFLTAIQKARKQKKPLEVSGCEVVADLLKPRVAAGETEQAYWRMLLECHQFLGQQEEFENLAVEFAVTFEISPPSWEAQPASAKSAKPVASAPRSNDDAFRLGGEIRGGRFDGLDAYLAEQPHPVVDMADVSRMDFASAGTLLNLVTPHKQRGVDLVLRHPNHLVAELLGLMGIGGFATIVFAKR
jgi:anti-anti-sigma regulatory factor